MDNPETLAPLGT